MVSVVTGNGLASGGAEGGEFPRLVQWAGDKVGSLVDGCYDGPEASFLLFPPSCIDYSAHCDGRRVEQPSPGLGACDIEVSAFEPDVCMASRAWLDPLDSDGVRICEVEPVDSAVMDRCVRDAECVGGGSGWCVTQAFEQASFCPAGSMLRPIRWVGGSLPDRGTVHVICREPSP